MKTCPKCGKPISENSNVCIACGYTIPEKVKKAPWLNRHRRRILFRVLAVIAVIAAVLAILIATHTICIFHDYQITDCEKPAACIYCGKTTGEAPGHDWQEANCTEPKTCARCGLTEGEALGHDWQEATCTEPETCSRCGLTEGEALGHQWEGGTCTEGAVCSVCGAVDDPVGHVWADANYQEPKTCTVCGVTDGDPLTPDFVTYDLGATDLSVSAGDSRELTVTFATDEGDRNCNADVSIAATASSGEGLLEVCGIEPIDGYTWMCAMSSAVTDHTNALNYGFDYETEWENYYDIALEDDTAEVYAEDITYTEGNYTLTGTAYRYAISCYGEDTTLAYYVYLEYSGSFEDSYGVISLHCFYVPQGYDGCVVGFYNANNVLWEDGAYCYDYNDPDRVYFRLVP